MTARLFNKISINHSLPSLTGRGKGVGPLGLLLALMGLFTVTSCDDMLETESDLYIYADGDNLSDATDTIYSMVGILNKLQPLADRTVLLGEVRGDLVDLTPYASTDLQQLASFTVTDENAYNNPRDYYAVINNCNYFLAHADTALKNNRGERIFEKEYAAVKGIRAWTYLQLALVYGSVPFVTEPLTSAQVDEADYPMADLAHICNYFIDDLMPYIHTEMPGYGTIGSVDSRFLYFPINILLGELNLWAGNYREAALSYYRYVSTRNGEGTSWPLQDYKSYWSTEETSYEGYYDAWDLNCFRTESYSTASELITLIPGDSITSSPYYSSLPSLWNTTTGNDGYYSLTPSAAIINLSQAQPYCNRNLAGEVSYAPTNLPDYMTGDLRLRSSWYTSTRSSMGEGRPQYQMMYKHSGGSPHVHLWRGAMVWLRMAEALNCAGFPQFAYNILATGVNNNTIDSLQHVYPADSVWLAQFNFPNTLHVLRTESLTGYTTIGVHSRGSGFTEWNEHYALPMPEDSLATPTEIVAYQQPIIEDLIMDECALEMAFEGHRFFDLMRVALRRGDYGYLARHITARRGEGASAGISADLTDPNNWYLSWQGRVGY